MEAEKEITIWLERMDAQPEESRHAIWEAFYKRVIPYVRKRLDTLPKRVADEEDIASAAMNSLFKILDAKKYPNLSDGSALWGMLLKIAARKVSRFKSQQSAQRRGGGQVRGESVFVQPGVNIGDVPSEPSPAFCEALIDELLERVRQIGDERGELIVVRKLEGFSNREISEELQCTERTVERKLEKIRNSWSHLALEADD